jgi:hypothetical protein
MKGKWASSEDDYGGVAYFSRNGATMSDQRAEDGPSQTAQAWDTVRRVREPLAWALLLLTAIILLVSACQLFHLAGAIIPVPATATTSAAPVGAAPSPPVVTVSAFALRASAVAPQFDALYVIALPVLAVVLVAFSGGLTERAREVVQTAAAVLAAALGLGVISVMGAGASHTRPGTWFILETPLLATVAAALLFTLAVFRSRALQPPESIDLEEDDEDFAADDE